MKRIKELDFDVRSWFATKIHIITNRTRQVITSADTKSKWCVDIYGTVVCQCLADNGIDIHDWWRFQSNDIFLINLISGT